MDPPRTDYHVAIVTAATDIPDRHRGANNGIHTSCGLQHNTA